jgi:hypothetical protein
MLDFAKVAAKNGTQRSNPSAAEKVAFQRRQEVSIFLLYSRSCSEYAYGLPDVSLLVQPAATKCSELTFVSLAPVRY